MLTNAPIAKKHATAVEQLLASGASLTHKTQLDELAYSLAGDNSHYGVSRNPLDPSRYSGGSSSGAAVSVAAQHCELALATDTGGSICVPASYCGLYGLRPTHGRVSVEGLFPLAPRFDTAGIMARDLSVLQQAAEVLLAAKQQDRQTASINTLLWCESLWEGVDTALRDYAWHCFSNFTGKTKKIDEPVLSVEERRQCFAVLQAESIWNTHQHWLAHKVDEFSEEIQTRLRWGQAFATDQEKTKPFADELARARDLFARWTQAQAQWLGKSTALLLPTTPSIAPKIDQHKGATQRNTLLSLTSIAGLSGWPQLQCPVYLDDGLPYGLSLIGDHDSDLLLAELVTKLF